MDEQQPAIMRFGIYDGLTNYMCRRELSVSKCHCFVISFSSRGGILVSVVLLHLVVRVESQ
jgi:hypothetical protein